jgi:hypothetical protein
MLNLLESQGMATDLRVLKPLLSQLSPLLATVKHGHDQDFAAMAPDHGINKVIACFILIQLLFNILTIDLYARPCPLSLDCLKIHGWMEGRSSLFCRHLTLSCLILN